MELPILIIGLDYKTKTTVVQLLALQLKLPFVSLSEVCQKYWQEIGYDDNLLDRAWEDGQADGVYRYLMAFEAYAVERAIAEYPECVIELSQSQTVYQDDELFEQVSQVLQPYPVILLLPSEDVEESLEIIQKCDRTIVNGMEINEHFIKHHSNYDLAKYIIYTKDRTPEQTTEKILAQIDPKASDIILIGAMGAGKSTVGKLLAQKLKLPQVSMDRLRWNYYRERGWTREKQKQIAEKEGFAGVYRYWKQFDLYAVERLLKEHQDCVIDFGAGHSIYEDDGDFACASELLASYTNTILLMPSSDLDESVAILNRRNTLMINGMEANRFFLTDPSNRKLAKLVVYTNDKTPNEIKEEILKQLPLN